MTFEDTHVFRIGADIVGSFRVVGAFGHPALDEFTSGWRVVRESTSEAENKWKMKILRTCANYHKVESVVTKKTCDSSYSWRASACDPQPLQSHSSSDRDRSVASGESKSRNKLKQTKIRSGGWAAYGNEVTECMLLVFVSQFWTCNRIQDKVFWYQDVTVLTHALNICKQYIKSFQHYKAHKKLVPGNAILLLVDKADWIWIWKYICQQSMQHKWPQDIPLASSRGTDDIHTGHCTVLELWVSLYC